MSCSGGFAHGALAAAATSSQPDPSEQATSSQTRRHADTQTRALWLQLGPGRFSVGFLLCWQVPSVPGAARTVTTHRYMICTPSTLDESRVSTLIRTPERVGRYLPMYVLAPFRGRGSGEGVFRVHGLSTLPGNLLSPRLRWGRYTATSHVRTSQHGAVSLPRTARSTNAYRIANQEMRGPSDSSLLPRLNMRPPHTKSTVRREDMYVLLGHLPVAGRCACRYRNRRQRSTDPVPSGGAGAEAHARPSPRGGGRGARRCAVDERMQCASVRRAHRDR